MMYGIDNSGVRGESVRGKALGLAPHGEHAGAQPVSARPGLVEPAATAGSSYPVYADLRWPADTGIGIVQRALLARKPEHAALIDLQAEGSIGNPFSAYALSRAHASAMHAHRDACQETANPRPGVFWSPGFVPPTSFTMPTVVTVHDLTHLHMYTPLHETYYNLVFKKLYRRCHSIVCVSEFVRQTFLEWSGIASEKVHVVLNGVSEFFYQRVEAGIAPFPFPYVLYVGNHRPYKNLQRLIAAYGASQLPGQGVHLVLTGTVNPALLEQAQRLDLHRMMHFTGPLEHQATPSFYRGALAVAFVSLYEGFGLPILEAMASGVPVLTSNITSMPEVAGDAAVLVDPYSVEAIADGLDRLASDGALRAALIQKGNARARNFDWNDSAEKLWRILDEAALDGTGASLDRHSIFDRAPRPGH